MNARRVVVCADSLRTPQVLFASGIRPPALGHYLNEHFQIFTLARLHSDYVSEPPAVGGPAPMGSVRIPLVSGDRAMQGQVVLLSRTGLRFPFGDASTATNDLAIFPWYGAKDIQYSDCVQFSETATDYYGMPAMTIHYTLTDTDRRTIELLEANTVRSAKLLGEPLGQAKLAPRWIIAALPRNHSYGRSQQWRIGMRHVQPGLGGGTPLCRGQRCYPDFHGGQPHTYECCARSQSSAEAREQPVSAALRAACGVASDQPGGPLIRDGNHLRATSGPDSLNKGRGLTLGRCREVWRAMLKLRTLSDRSWGSW